MKIDKKNGIQEVSLTQQDRKTIYEKCEDKFFCLQNCIICIFCPYYNAEIKDCIKPNIYDNLTESTLFYKEGWNHWSNVTQGPKKPDND